MKIFVSLFLFTLIIRLPFFFQDVIDWDESTFILMGQSILDGHLPYTDIWDNKPPLLFGVFAVFIKIFGHHILGIRFAGSICVAIAAFLLYLILNQGWGKRVGIIASLVSIYTMTVLTSGQAVMSEHIALVPVMSAFYILSNKDNQKTINCLIVGILLAGATFIRLNLIYLDLIVAIWLFISFLKQKESFISILRKALAYGLGNIVILLATFLPYFYAGESSEWWQSVILAPLNYATAKGSFFSSLFYFMVGDEIGAMGFLSTIISSWYIWRSGQAFSPIQQKIWQISIVFYGAIAISIIQSGAVYDHYLIQITPFWGLIPILALTLPHIFGKRQKIISGLLIGILFLSLIRPEFPFKGYLNLSTQFIQHHNPWMGSSYPIADYINQRATEQPSIYILGSHFVYWLTNTMPLSKCSTHPSNLFRESLLPYCGMNGNDSSSLSELQYILDQKPQYILVNDQERNHYLKAGTNVKILFQESLDSSYELVLTVGQDKLYARLK